jgi:hypothetical protein
MIMMQTDCSFSACFGAAAFFLSVAFACGCEDCG